VAWVGVLEAEPVEARLFRGLAVAVLITVTPVYVVAMILWVLAAGGSPS
jgi:hypothetical protein